MAYAGMDIGTSGCKMLVYDIKGNVLYKTARKYDELGGNGHRELDPGSVMLAVKEMLLEVGEKCRESIQALAVTSLGESVVCLDEKNNVLANSMLTGDSRGIVEIDEIKEKIGERKIFEITGLPPNELYGLPKYMWLNQNTDVIKKAKFIFFYEDFVGYFLTGNRKVSYTSAARSLAFDIHNFQWSEELLDLAGIQRKQMSEPIEPCGFVGQILPERAKEFHLNPKMKIVAGGHDQTCAALGAGLAEMDTGECGMGTCEFMFTMLPNLVTNKYMLENDFTCIPYVLPQKYLSSIEITTCGALKNWAKDTIFCDVTNFCEKNGINFWKKMDNLAKDIRTDVFVLPQFGSSGNPNLSMNAKGVIAGLTIHTRQEEIYRGILEGMAFQMYLAYERMKKLGTKMKKIVVTGGGAASELALQIRADVFNMKVISLLNDEAGTLGCMMMAATADGIYSSLDEAIKTTVKVKKEYIPDLELHEYYMEKYQRYKILYNGMYDFK